MTDIQSIEDVNNEIQNNTLVLLDFYATWCGPCKMLAPILEQYEKEHTDIVVLKVNVDTLQELANLLKVQSVPTLILYKNGKMVAERQGFVPKPILEKWVLENIE